MASEVKGIIICLSPRGKPTAEKIKKTLGNSWDLVLFDKAKDGNIGNVFEFAWKYPAIVSIMANAITIRSIAKLISSKKTDPAVVGLDEKGRFIVSLIGGHEAGANELARKIAKEIGTIAVISTASELKDLPAISRRNFIGVGCRRGTGSQEIMQAINNSLEKCGLSLPSVAGIATIELKKKEKGILEAGEKLGLKVVFFSADELKSVNVKKGSKFVKSKVGVEAVSEPAAILAAGSRSELLLSKNIVGGVTVSITRASWPLSE